MSRFPVISRRLVALAVLTSIATATAGCSSTLDDAATVTFREAKGGEATVVHISRDDLGHDLRLMRDNKGFVDFLKQNQFEIPDSKDAVGSMLAARWLSLLLEQAAIDFELKARGVKITAEDRASAKDTTADSYGGKKVFAKFPKAFRDDLIEYTAARTALQARGVEAASAPTEEDARKFYEDNKDQLGACATGKSVAHILVATEAEANDVLAALGSGADFKQLAKDRSTDPTAADNGGDLGCLQQGAFVAEFEQAAMAAKIGEPTQPVKTQYGFHVILVTEYQPPSFDALKDRILEYLASQSSQSSGQEINSIVLKRLTDAEVDIDPRYGEWVVDDTQGPHVQEPGSPEPADGPNGAATTTTAVQIDPLTGAPAQGG